MGMVSILKQAFSRVKSLSPEVRNSITTGVLAEVHLLTHSGLSAERHDILVERLSQPLERVSPAVVKKCLRCTNPDDLRVAQ